MNRLEFELNNGPSAAHVRYFSLEQANRALVLVGRVVGDIVRGHHRLLDLQETLEQAMDDGTHDRCQGVRQELIHLVESLQSCLEELSDIGVELKDWAMGIVDFPCLAEGREVYLTWQHGEPAVAHWREVNDNLESRQPTSTLLMERMAHMAGR